MHGLFSSCDERGLLPSCSVRASYCAGSSGCRTWALGHDRSVIVAYAALVDPWDVDLPGPGMEPVSSSLAGRFFNTATRKASYSFFFF